mmetsp:Transcript_6704/g.15957  ORF Transcript_6704/g.15957 Transcript_6704/m.15957 type:complete len:268 (+) Transcript_6704:166-969(+)
MPRQPPRLQRRVLDEGQIADEEENTRANEDCRKDAEVPRGPGEGAVPPDRRARCPRSQHIAKLHDHERIEVEALSVSDLVLIAVGAVKLEQQVARVHALGRKVCKERGIGYQRDDRAQEGVGVEDELPRDEVISPNLPRWHLHNGRLRLLIDHGQRGSNVRSATDHDHEEGGECQRHCEEDVGQDGPHLSPRACGQQVDDDFLEVGKATAAVLHTQDNICELVIEDDEVGGLFAHVRATPHGNAAISLTQRRCVVDAVAGDCDALPP